MSPITIKRAAWRLRQRAPEILALGQGERLVGVAVARVAVDGPGRDVRHHEEQNANHAGGCVEPKGGEAQFVAPTAEHVRVQRRCGQIQAAVALGLVGDFLAAEVAVPFVGPPRAAVGEDDPSGQLSYAFEVTDLIESVECSEMVLPGRGGPSASRDRGPPYG